MRCWASGGKSYAIPSQPWETLMSDTVVHWSMPGPAFLRGESVTLHPQGEDDVEFILEVLNDPDVWPSMGSYEPISEAQEREWIENADDDGVHLLICAEGERVGTIGLSDIHETWGLGELGYMVAPGAQGNGYATDAGRRLVRYAFEDRRLHKIKANAYGTNPASQRVLEKIGFEKEGVFESHAYVRGEYVDLHRYGLLEDDFDS